jgi:hypothetical protein
MVFSDFDGLDDASEGLLRKLAASNDLILFHVADPQAFAPLPDRFRLTISDGALQADLDGSQGDIRAQVEATLQDRLAHLYEWSNRYGFPIVPLTTETPALDQIRALFGHGGRVR